MDLSPQITRRQFTAFGLGGATLALQTLLAGDASGEQRDKPPHHKPTAKSVILLFMSGGPSQVDTFDPKPELAKLEGADVPETIAARVPRIKRAGLKNLMASPWDFAQHGESGLWVSSLFPETAKHVDDLCVLRSMTHRNPVHGPGECVALTGSGIGDRPSLGAWSLYGLGSANEELPAFISMNLHTDGMQHPQAAGWGTGFLPSRLQGTVVDPVQGIHFLKMPAKTKIDQRQDELAVIRELDQKWLKQLGDHSDLEARIKSYQTAFQMQTSAPELFDMQSETAKTIQRYGINEEPTKVVGRSCLLARRMVERGVRFVQLRVGGWDAHGNIRGNHDKMAARTDRPIAALLQDLKEHGLLDSTLVVWGGEFGRTPTMEGLGKGRDHSPTAYTMWLAGGGIRGGKAIGETDEIGYTVIDRPIRPQDLHATVLHALGIEFKRLVYDHHGLKETPLGVTGGAAVEEAFT